jgi:hypothetical protein
MVCETTTIDNWTRYCSGTRVNLSIGWVPLRLRKVCQGSRCCSTMHTTEPTTTNGVFSARSGSRWRIPGCHTISVTRSTSTSRAGQMATSRLIASRNSRLSSSFPRHLHSEYSPAPSLVTTCTQHVLSTVLHTYLARHASLIHDTTNTVAHPLAAGESQAQAQGSPCSPR